MKHLLWTCAAANALVGETSGNTTRMIRSLTLIWISLTRQHISSQMQCINMRIETGQLVFRNVKQHLRAASCILVSLQRSLSASCALPSGLLRHAILAIRRSRSSARTRWKQTHRTHIWCLFRQHRNRAARGAGRKVACLAAPSFIISRSLSRSTECDRRLRL